VERIELQCGWKSSKEGKADSFSISKSNGDEYFLKDLLVYFVNTFATFEISETRLTETTKSELFFFFTGGTRVVIGIVNIFRESDDDGVHRRFLGFTLGYTLRNCHSLDCHNPRTVDLLITNESKNVMIHH
jgi:hypothetical protein